VVKRRTRGLTRRRVPRALTIPEEIVEELSPTQRRVFAAVQALKGDPESVVPVTGTDHAVGAVCERISVRLKLTEGILDARKYMPRTYFFLRDMEDEDAEWERVWSEPCPPLLVRDLATLLQVFEELRQPVEEVMETLSVCTYPLAGGLSVVFLIAQYEEEEPQAYLLTQGKQLPLRFDQGAIKEAVAEFFAPGTKLLEQWNGWRQDLEQAVRTRLLDAQACASDSTREDEAVEGPVGASRGTESGEPLLTDADMVAYLKLTRDWASQPMNEAEEALDAVLKALVRTGEKLADQIGKQARDHEREVRKQEKRHERLQMTHDGLKARVQRQEKELAELRRQLAGANPRTGHSTEADSQTLEKALERWF